MIEIIKNKKYTIAVWLLVIVSFVSSCNKEALDETNQSLGKKLLRAWTIDGGGFVTLNGVDISNEFDKLEYTFKPDGTYEKNVNGDVSSGTWTETDQTFTTLELDDQQYVNILELTDETLRFTYINSGGRVKGVGEFEIMLRSK